MTEQPRRELFMHAGLPRTGTKSLQRLMWNSGERLAGRGCEYPRVAVQWDYLAHHVLAREIAGDGPGPEAKAILDHVAASALPAVVISSEGLMLPLAPGPPEPLIEFLHRCAEVRPTHFVLTLRRMDGYFGSVYLHELKYGNHPPPVDAFVAGSLGWIDVLFGNLARVRDESGVDVRLPAYVEGRDSLEPTFEALGLPGFATTDELPRHGRRLGLKAQSLLGWSELFDLPGRGIDIDRDPLIVMFEEGRVELPGDVYDYDVLGGETRELLVTHAAAVARRHGFHEYLQAFPPTPIEARAPQRPAPELVAESDLDALAASLTAIGSPP